MARIGAEERRQDFIQATIRVIAEHGVANATTRRIASEANSPLASLHYVFHTKDDLFYAVYESLFDMPQQAINNVPQGMSAADTIAAVLQHLVEWFATHPEIATTLSELFAWTRRNNPPMASQMYHLAGEATERSIAKMVGSELDPASLTVVTRLQINLFDGLLLAWSGHNDPARLEEETETACQALRLLVSSYSN